MRGYHRKVLPVYRGKGNGLILQEKEFILDFGTTIHRRNCPALGQVGQVGCEIF